MKNYPIRFRAHRIPAPKPQTRDPRPQTRHPTPHSLFTVPCILESVPFPHPMRRATTLTLTLALFSLPAHPAERVSLQNGFALRCDHHATVNGQTRLFLSAGEDNYIDLPPQQIATFETVPDLPPTPAAKTPISTSDRPADQPRVPQVPPLGPGSKKSPTPNSNNNSRVPQVPPLGPGSQKSQTPNSTNISRVPQVPPLGPGNQSSPTLNPADLAEMLSRAGLDHNLDVDLLASLVKAESNGNTRALSRAGAAGLMQLMPATANDLGVHDRFEPGQNVQGGSTYLDALLTHYHDNLALALAAYNAGPAAVDKYHGIPPYAETRAYVARVIHEFNRRVLAREALAREAHARLAAASAPASPQKH